MTVHRGISNSLLIGIFAIAITLGGGILTVWMHVETTIATMQVQIDNLREDLKELQHTCKDKPDEN